MYHTKIKITAVFIALALSSCSAMMDKKKENIQSDLLSPALFNLLEVTGIKHDGTLTSIVAETQKAWLRRPGTERWNMEDNFEALKPQIMPLLKELGFLDEALPPKYHYKYALILGSTVSGMRKRISYLLELYKRGMRFANLVFLVGARPLDPIKESPDILYKRDNQYLPFRPGWKQPVTPAQTETEVAHMIFDQAELPAYFKDSVKIHFVDTPMQKNDNGTLRRPNTGDTVNHWLKQGIEPGTVLAISNQPYVRYQEAVLKTYLPSSFTVETAGRPKASGKFRVGVVLDTLARWLYQEKKYRDQTS
jgi:hypothetical protein